VEIDYDGWDLDSIEVQCEVRQEGLPSRTHTLVDWGAIPKVGKITFPRPVDITPDIGAHNANLTKDVNDRLSKKEAIAASVSQITKDVHSRLDGVAKGREGTAELTGNVPESYLYANGLGLCAAGSRGNA
jgi:hypothetical protein